MISTNEVARAVASRKCLRLMLACLALGLPAASARAQMSPDSSESYRILMQHRMEMTRRSIDETQRRRFEEGKPDGPFPSDANKESARPGVVRAASPEEQKALVHNERGLDLFSKGKLEQAVKEYDEAISAYPQLAAAHNNLGSAYFALGRFENAAAAFRDAVQIDPRYAQAHFNLALAYIKLGREKEANDSLMNAARAYDAAGDEHLKAGRMKEAEESYKGLLQIDPDYTFALFKLGLVCNADRRYDEAVEYFRRVIRKQPTDSDAFEALGEAYFGQSKYAESAEAAEQAVKLDAASPGPFYIAGLAHASLGDTAKAKADLDRLKELKADDYAKQLSDFIEKKAQGKP